MLLIWAFNIFSKAPIKIIKQPKGRFLHKLFFLFQTIINHSNHRFFFSNSNPLDLNSNSAQKYEKKKKISQRQWTRTLKGSFKVHDNVRDRVIFQKNIYKWSSKYKDSEWTPLEWACQPPSTGCRAAAVGMMDGFQGLGEVSFSAATNLRHLAAERPSLHCSDASDSVWLIVGV